MKIGFAGMSHLGQCSAAAAAIKGFEAVCFGDFETLTDTTINDALKQNAARIREVSNPLCLGLCDIVYVTLDVITDEYDNIDTSEIEEMVTTAIEYAKPEAPIVILSQVPPGFCRDFRRDNLYFQVDTIIMNKAMDRAINPERIIIGCADVDKLPDEKLLNFLCAFNCQIQQMVYESAEMVQKAVNIMLAAQVSVTNTLSEICEVVGATWADVAAAVKTDKRIGQFAYMVPGPGLSGGHLERDIQTIRRIGMANHLNVDVPASFMKHSDYRKRK